MEDVSIYYVICITLFLNIAVNFTPKLENLINNYSTRFVNKGPILNTKTTNLYELIYTNMAISFKLKLVWNFRTVRFKLINKVFSVHFLKILEIMEQWWYKRTWTI